MELLRQSLAQSNLTLITHFAFKKENEVTFY